MKGLLDKLLKSLGFSGRDWAALLLALLLAFSIWLIHNLSLKYNDYLTVSVVASCNLDGHSEQSVNQCEVVARCRATGYNVISKNIKAAQRVKKVVFQPSVMKRKDADTFYVTSSDLLEYGHLIFGDDVTVEYFVSDTLFFRFPIVDYKRVPVYPVHSISFREQYMNIGDLQVSPDSVTIYGEPFRLENIDRVYTQPIKRTDLDSDIQGVAPIEKIRDVRLSETEVHYTLDVSRYVDMKETVTVGVVNLPKDKEIVILPSSVEISLKCTFPMKGDPAKGIRCYVDYSDFINSISGKCPVIVDAMPKGIIGFEVDPLYVECIIYDK